MTLKGARDATSYTTSLRPRSVMTFVVMPVCTMCLSTSEMTNGEHTKVSCVCGTKELKTTRKYVSKNVSLFTAIAPGS